MTHTRPLQKSDWEDWKRLWTDYLTFYETELSEDIYTSSFNRMLGDDPADFNGIVAEKDGQIIGLTLNSVYWMTQEFNHTARQLYDRIAKKTPFVQYART